MPGSKTSAAKLRGIQMLRALAALLVLFYHLRGNELAQINLAGTQETALFGDTFSRGFIGVDLFFVISGFIMAYVTHDLVRGWPGVKQFALARVFRIYPVWWLFAGALAVISIVVAGTLWHPAAFDASQGNGYVFMAKSFLLIPQQNMPSLNVGWTLIHEMGFYLVFAGLLFLPRKLLPAGLALWAVIIALAVAFRRELAITDPTLKVLLSPMSLEFVLGAFAGYAFAIGFRKFRLIAFGAGLVASLVIYMLMPLTQAETSRLEAVSYFAIPFTLLVYGSTALDDYLSTNAVYRGISRIGDWSYSLYLCHPIVLLVLPVAMKLIAGAVPATSGLLIVGSEGIADNIIFNVLAISGALICAGLSFHVFERPVLRFLTRKFRKPQADTDKARLNETVAP